MLAHVDAAGPSVFVVTVFVAFNKNAEAAFAALVSMAAVGLFLFIAQSFDDSLTPRN